MIAVRRLALPAALTCAVVLLPTTAAAAAEPEKAGWWNRLSAGGLVAPAPTTQPGDLRVASGDESPTAYAALLYPAPGSTSAALDLQIRPGSAVGTPEVVACPTLTTDWPEGENQPDDQAPEFDCDLGLAFGSPSEDGTTLSFLLDGSTQTEPGVWSLALVPQPGSTNGLFALDIQKPGPEAFVAAPPEGVSEEPSGTAVEPEPFTPAPESDVGGSGEAFFPEAFAPPPSLDSFDTGGTGSAETAPLVAGGDQAPLPEPAAPQPDVAAVAPGNPPVLLARPAGVVEDLGSGRRLLGLLVLAGGSAAVGYAAGQQRPGPRLIGGRARALPATAAVPGPAAGAGPAAVSQQERARGIGRFAKTRDRAPRRLR